MKQLPASYLDWFMDQPWRTEYPLVMLYILENEACIDAELAEKESDNGH